MERRAVKPGPGMFTPTLWAAMPLLLFLAACGASGELSRSEAEKALEKKINEGGDFPTVAVQVGEHYFQPLQGGYPSEYVCFPLMASGRNPAGYLPYTAPRGKWRNWEAAAKAGFIVATAQEVRGKFLGMDYTATKCTIRLTDKAKPFIKDSDRGGLVTLRPIDGVNVKVTGVTKPTQGTGQTASEVEFSFDFRFNSLGEALSAPGLDSTDSSDLRKGGSSRALFKLYDDGWRLATGF